MDLLFCLEDILSYFRPLFNQQNFALFQAMVYGFIANTHGGPSPVFINQVSQRRSIGLLRSFSPAGRGMLMLLLSVS